MRSEPIHDVRVSIGGVLTVNTRDSAPAIFVAMDHETKVRHLVAMWTVEGSRGFTALARKAADGRLPLSGEAYLSCVLEGPHVISMQLHGEDRWVTVIVRTDGLDSTVEVRSHGMRVSGRLFDVEKDRFVHTVERIARALDSVMKPVWARGVGTAAS